MHSGWNILLVTLGAALMSISGWDRQTYIHIRQMHLRFLLDAPTVITLHFCVASYIQNKLLATINSPTTFTNVEKIIND